MFCRGPPYRRLLNLVLRLTSLLALLSSLLVTFDPFFLAHSRLFHTDPLLTAFATLSFLALPVIPELRLTDLGLVDVNAFKVVK